MSEFTFRVIYKITFNDGSVGLYNDEESLDILMIPKKIRPGILYDPKWHLAKIEDIIKEYKDYFISTSIAGEKNNNIYITNIEYSHKEMEYCV